MCQLHAEFLIDGSLLIRSGSTQASDPDAIHIHSMRDGRPVPILSGTSLAGALRARALRICNTFGDRMKASAFTSQLFGPIMGKRGNTPGADSLGRRTQTEPEERPGASRLHTFETEITNPVEVVQNRIKIDRFTGGAYPGALFNEQPVFGTPESIANVHVTIDSPTPTGNGPLVTLDQGPVDWRFASRRCIEHRTRAPARESSDPHISGHHVVHHPTNVVHHPTR